MALPAMCARRSDASCERVGGQKDSVFDGESGANLDFGRAVDAQPLDWPMKEGHLAGLAD